MRGFARLAMVGGEAVGYDEGVDPLRAHDLDVARLTPPSEKARQALEAMRFGIELKWVSLRTRFPDATEDEIDQMLRAWLADG